MQGQDILFDSNDLQTANIVTTSIEHSDYPNKIATSYPIAHANASVIPFINYSSKTITIGGMLTTSSIQATDALIDTFKGYFNTNGANLDIAYNGVYRRYLATATDIKITRPGGLSYATFTVTFFCLNPFGKNTTSSSLLSASGRTLSTYSDNISITGTAPLQQPIITLTYTAITGGTSQNVTVGNSNNGQQLTVTRTWSTGDVLTIDVTQKLATVNGTMVDYSGAFPEFPPGNQTISYSDGFTTRTFNISVVYYAQWL